MRSEFEKAYEPNPHKSPFTEVRFNEEKQIYEPLNPQLDRVARSLNAAWYGYRIRQTEVDELQKRVDAAHDALTELKEISEALHHRWQIFSDSVALAEAEMTDMCVKELEQALKGGEA